MKAGDLKTIKWFKFGSEGFLSHLPRPNNTRTSDFLPRKIVKKYSYWTAIKCDRMVIKWKLVIWRFESNNLSSDPKDSYFPSPSKAKSYWWGFQNLIRSQLNLNAFNLLPSNVCKKLHEPNKIMKWQKRAFNG